jgi:hypothetical protein
MGTDGTGHYGRAQKYRIERNISTETFNKKLTKRRNDKYFYFAGWFSNFLSGA